MNAGPNASTLRVGAAPLRHWHSGECFLFDEQVEHEVRIEESRVPGDSRIVLLIDFVNPFLARREDFRRAVSPEAWASNSSVYDAIRDRAHASRCWLNFSPA